MAKRPTSIQQEADNIYQILNSHISAKAGRLSLSGNGNDRLMQAQSMFYYVRMEPSAGYEKASLQPAFLLSLSLVGTDRHTYGWHVRVQIVLDAIQSLFSTPHDYHQLCANNFLLFSIPFN